MKGIISAFLNFLMWLPVSVGNHTDYSAGGGSTHSYSGGGSTHFYGGGGGGSFSTFEIVAVVIIVLGVVIFSYVRKKNGKPLMPGNMVNNNPPSNIPAPIDISNQIIEKIMKNDENFSKEKFLSWSEQVFTQLQQAWTERDWKKARPFESEELFNLHKSQLDDFINNGKINIMANVCVNESYLIDYSADKADEYVTVFMKTRYNDYIIKEDTKEVLQGDPNRTYYVNYNLKFMRSINVKTGEFSNKSTHNCPNCGAPVDVNAAGQCAYCGTVITDGNHDWVLCNIDDVGQA